VTIGSALILYAIVIGLAGPAAFRRAVWPVRAPRLGAAAVLAAAWSVPVALVLAGVTIALPATALSADIGRLIGACLARLRAAYGTPGGTGIITAGQVLTVATAARIAWAAGRVTQRRRTGARRHQLLVRLAGHRRPDLPALVLDSPQTAAYSVAGRHPDVVVTSGAIELLTEPQLGAVLAHENAHLRARHHRWQVAAAVVADALPIVPLLREVPARVGQLLEMDADELAAHHHGPRVLAGALVAVASVGGPAATGVTVPSASTLTPAGADAVARIRRLMCPPDELPRRRRTLTRAAIVALTVAPLLLAAAPALVALQ
jgi:Zn-dependent protease with chaperone function